MKVLCYGWEKFIHFAVVRFHVGPLSCHLDPPTLARVQASMAAAAAAAAGNSTNPAVVNPVRNLVSAEGQTFTGSATTETGAIGFGVHIATGVSFESLTSSVSLGVSPTQSMTTYTHTTIFESLPGTQQTTQLATEGPPAVSCKSPRADSEFKENAILPVCSFIINSQI